MEIELGSTRIDTLLPHSEVVIEVAFTGAGRLPPFRGATVRGGLGYQLKKTVCHVHNNSCSECIMRQRCAYSYVFEGVAPPDRQIKPQT
jgi:hypothetical protein